MKNKNRIKNRILKGAVCATVLSALIFGVAGCGNSDSADDGDTVTISYWGAKGEDSSFYSEYEDNPVMKYIESHYTFNDKKLHIDFFMAPPGSEQDDFSTLLGTGDYCDVMDMSMATTSAPELYEEDIIWDLTELVPANMPNMMAFLEENPDCEEALYSIVDGEKKILQLYSFMDAPDPNFQGFCYRRDWIAKYGVNPQTGEAFTYGFTDENDYESWQDNVVFPNGTSEPLYISDWEWMFEIFDKAMADLGITDGYGYSPYYLGYLATGDLNGGFGGGGAHWYREGDTCVYGITTDNFRAYLQCMNTWYANGWIDPAFAEHTTDMFFAVDTAKVFQGKVGLWQGRQSTLGVQLDSGDGYTSGAVVFGCRQPINDIYGGEAQQNKEPNMMYQSSKISTPVVLTTKMTEDEVVTFLKFCDFLFTEEGALLRSGGLSKEQYEECQDELYTRLGLTEGRYYLEERDGVQVMVFNLENSSDEFSPTCLGRFSPSLAYIKNTDLGLDRYVSEGTQNWNYYTDTASLSVGVTNAISVEDQQTMTKINASLNQFLARSIAPMIKGSGYDVWDDASWEQFLTDVSKYNPQAITEIYQNAIDTLLQ